MAQEDLLQRLVDALGMVDAHALVTTGPGLRSRRLARVPADVHVVEAAPHGAVLPHVDLVVTHGGHGTVVRALAGGVPVVVVPISRDQPDNAARVLHHGVGRKVSKRSPRGDWRRRSSAPSPTTRSGPGPAPSPSGSPPTWAPEGGGRPGGAGRRPVLATLRTSERCSKPSVAARCCTRRRCPERKDVGTGVTCVAVRSSVAPGDPVPHPVEHRGAG